MRKYFGAAAVLVFLLALVLAVWGGKDPFISPISSIPSLLIDQNHNETEIFVKGLNDFRYTNMTITIAGENQTYERNREDAYFVYFNTSMANFTVNITVWNRDREYTFNGSVQVASPDESPKLMTLYEEKRDRINTYTLDTGNLPWRKLMERVR
jgi:hypothetical protein